MHYINLLTSIVFIVLSIMVATGKYTPPKFFVALCLLALAMSEVADYAP